MNKIEGMEQKEIETIIKKVSEKVIQTLEKKEKINEEEIVFTKKEKVLLIIPQYAANKGRMIKNIEGWYKDKKIIFLGMKQKSFKIRNDIDLTDINDENVQSEILEELEKYKTIIYMNPSIKQLKAVVEMDDGDYSKNLILESLLHGKEVEIVIDEKIDKKPQNGVQKKYCELLETAKEMGIKIKKGNKEDWKKNGEGSVDPLKKATYQKELILEKNIEEMKHKGESILIIDKQEIITPLAIDRARELGIEIKYKKK